MIIGGGINVTGIGTIGRVKIFNDGTGGIVTATTGIITYYGDGQYLTNIQSGVGIATTNPTTGYSETVGLGATIITFAGPGVSTNAQHNGGTGVTVNAASGIATVYIAGGGSGGGFQTIIQKSSTTVGAGGQIYLLQLLRILLVISMYMSTAQDLMLLTLRRQIPLLVLSH